MEYRFREKGAISPNLKMTNSSDKSLKSILFFLLFLISSLTLAKNDDHSIPPEKRGMGKAEVQGDPTESCLGGRGLAAFANGEEYDIAGIISYLADPACEERRPEIARSAISQRIAFNEVPYRLKQAALNFNPSSLKSVEETNQALSRSVPLVLKEHPLSNQDLLPILGQVSVLSATAGKKILGAMIQNELVAADGLMKNSARSKSGFAGDLARTLLNYGANNPAIAGELAEATEEMALSAQVNSLGKVLSSLAEAARVESNLIPTLQLTAGATRRGIEKGTVFFSTEDSHALLKLIFDKIKPQFLADSAFDPVSDDYNRAMKVLLNDKSLNKTVLRDAWRESLRILSANRNQTALAKAVALSLTGDIVYLGDSDKRLMLMASNNFSALAIGLQRSFLSAWNENLIAVQEGSLPAKVFNDRKDRFFGPFAEGILELEPEFIETEWLKFAWEKGLVKPQQIETRLPKLVLVKVKRRERAMKASQTGGSFQGYLESLAENLAVTRALSSVELPALNVWIKKTEEESPGPSLSK